MKIVSYNIQNGGVEHGPLIPIIIKQLDADILVIEEAVDLDLIQTASTKYSMFFYVARGNDKHNIVLLSRHRLKYFNSFHPFPMKHTLLEAKLERNRQYISFYCVHLAPYPFLLFEVWRLLEVNKILSRVIKPGAKDIIMCGDFNSVAPKDTVSLGRLPRWMKATLILTQGGKFPRHVIKKFYGAGLLDCYRELNNDGGYTLPAQDPHIRLDYFFVSQSLMDKINKCQVIVQPDVIKRVSDHLPILLEINI